MVPPAGAAAYPPVVYPTTTAAVGIPATAAAAETLMPKTPVTADFQGLRLSEQSVGTSEDRSTGSRHVSNSSNGVAGSVGVHLV